MKTCKYPSWLSRIMFVTLQLLWCLNQVHGADKAAWTNAPLGYMITSLSYSRNGVHVAFETDLPPPHIVAVFRPEEYSLGRNFPIRHRIVWDKETFLEGDFVGYTVFTQVGAVGSMMTMPDARDLTADEILRWKARASERIWTTPFSADQWKQYHTPSMDLCSDYTWVGFVPGETTGLSVRGRSVDADGSWSTTDKIAVAEYDSSVGAGTRVIYFEDVNEWMFARAYSARTNRSVEVFCQRGFKTLTSKDGYVLRPDWQGHLSTVEAPTNAVDSVVYPEGL